MLKSSRVPESRITTLNSAVPNPDGEFVLYWMIANRRTQWNFSLQRALEWSKELNRPLIIFEALRSDYRWASDRIHAFVVQGMVDNEAWCRKKKILYYPYLERSNGEGRGLLTQLCQKACLVVTDNFPCFFLPRMTRAAARRAPILFETVDSNGLLPLSIPDKTFTRAHSFRRYLQKVILDHLAEAPEQDPTLGRPVVAMATLPKEIAKRWQPADPVTLLKQPDPFGGFEIDHSVTMSPIRGGASTAHEQLDEFIENRLEFYADDRNHPDHDISSGLSPYLHFGHISAHQVFQSVMARDDWDQNCVAEKPSGSRDGWWGVSPEVESFLDELITWREVGYNLCYRESNYDKYESLPDWAQTTLADHRNDARDYIYSLEEFEAAETHDPIWNAAQRQLIRNGRMHNYLRMLWGKKILHWSESPQVALDVMIELNNKFALDGRNPNSYSGIFWVLGRYDRAWGPERPVFGKIRYMTSESTQRKLRMKNYLQTYS